MTTALASLTSTCRKHQCVSFALKVRSAWALNNFHKYFKMHDEAPRMCGYLLDWFADRARKTALKAVVKSYVALFLFLTYLRKNSTFLIPTYLCKKCNGNFNNCDVSFIFFRVFLSDEICLFS